MQHTSYCYLITAQRTFAPVELREKVTSKLITFDIRDPAVLTHFTTFLSNFQTYRDLVPAVFDPDAELTAIRIVGTLTNNDATELRYALDDALQYGTSSFPNGRDGQEIYLPPPPGLNPSE